MLQKKEKIRNELSLTKDYLIDLDKEKNKFQFNIIQENSENDIDNDQITGTKEAFSEIYGLKKVESINISSGMQLKRDSSHLIEEVYEKKLPTKLCSDLMHEKTTIKVYSPGKFKQVNSEKIDSDAIEKHFDFNMAEEEMDDFDERISDKEIKQRISVHKNVIKEGETVNQSRYGLDFNITDNIKMGDGETPFLKKKSAIKTVHGLTMDARLDTNELANEANNDLEDMDERKELIGGKLKYEVRTSIENVDIILNNPCDLRKVPTIQSEEYLAVDNMKSSKVKNEHKNVMFIDEEEEWGGDYVSAKEMDSEEYQNLQTEKDFELKIENVDQIFAENKNDKPSYKSFLDEDKNLKIFHSHDPKNDIKIGFQDEFDHSIDFFKPPNKHVTLEVSNSPKKAVPAFTPQKDADFKSPRGSLRNDVRILDSENSNVLSVMHECRDNRQPKYHHKMLKFATLVHDEEDFKDFCHKKICKNQFIDPNTPYQNPIYEDKEINHLSINIGKLSLSKRSRSKNSKDLKEMVSMILIIENKTNLEIDGLKLNFSGDGSLKVKHSKKGNTLTDMKIYPKSKQEIRQHFFVEKVPYSFQQVFGCYIMTKADDNKIIPFYEFEFTIPMFFHQFFVGSPEFKRETFFYQWKLFKSIALRYVTPYFLFNKEVQKDENDILKIFPNRVDLGHLYYKYDNYEELGKLVDPEFNVTLKQIGFNLSFESYTFLIRITFDDNLVGFLELVTENAKEDTSRVAKFQLQNLYIVLKNKESDEVDAQFQKK